MTTTNPALLAIPIAENGNKNTLPETQSTPGQMSQSTGFPAETSLPLGAGGVAPSREDFNGAFNLLGGVAFYAQKGWIFQYDAGQDYFAGCIVRDASDGKLYECIANMTAGTIAPHSDTANDYWILYTSGLSRELIPAFNKRDVITTSGAYTAPVTGWYKITVKGGGGGGAGGYKASGATVCGGGGGEGGTTIAYEHLTAGDTATVVIGAGGAGGAASTDGNNGGNSTVTVNSNTYTGGGGDGGVSVPSTKGVYGGGGSGTFQGQNGSPMVFSQTSNVPASAGGGVGGAPSAGYSVQGGVGITGGGGGGAAGIYSGSQLSGGAGGDGFASFEYFDI